MEMESLSDNICFIRKSLTQSAYNLFWIKQEKQEKWPGIY